MTVNIYMISVLACAVVLIIVLCVWARMHAFLALLAACLFIAFATRMPLKTIEGVIDGGVGSTLGFLTPILVLGAIIARLLEVSGGAHVLGSTIIKGFRPSFAPWAMLVIAYVCGLSLFFQVGIALLVPIMFQIIAETGQPAIQIILSTVTSLLIVHCMVPPSSSCDRSGSDASRRSWASNWIRPSGWSSRDYRRGTAIWPVCFQKI